jgi:DNA-directed RNA polymerase specialized sigma24 family protein
MANHHLKERTRELVNEFCAGNDHAFAELYDLYVQMLFNYGMKITQDQELLKDCIHDVFVKIYNKRAEKSVISFFCQGDSLYPSKIYL